MLILWVNATIFIVPCGPFSFVLTRLKFPLPCAMFGYPKKGGAAILKRFNGKDATNAFAKIGHSQHAVDLLKTFVAHGSSNEKLSTRPISGAWRKKLFTHEDPRNIHKFCGLFVLLHFAFRFYQMLLGDVSAGFGSRMGIGPSFRCIACLIPHVILSLSSLIFHSVPKDRVVGSPMIWQEFRAHSIIFAMRSIMGTICAWISVYLAIS